MNSTREEALDMMKAAHQKGDYELANMIIEYISWLDRKATAKNA